MRPRYGGTVFAFDGVHLWIRLDLAAICCHMHRLVPFLGVVGADWAGLYRIVVQVEVGELVVASYFVQIRCRGVEWRSDHVLSDAWLHMRHLFAPLCCYTLYSLPCLSYKYSSFPSLTQQVQLGPASATESSCAAHASAAARARLLGSTRCPSSARASTASEEE